jgi:hypothetical protein
MKLRRILARKAWNRRKVHRVLKESLTDMLRN